MQVPDQGAVMSPARTGHLGLEEEVGRGQLELDESGAFRSQRKRNGTEYWGAISKEPAS